MLFLITLHDGRRVRRVIVQAVDERRAWKKAQVLIALDGPVAPVVITQLSKFLTDMAELPTLDLLHADGKLVTPPDAAIRRRDGQLPVPFTLGQHRQLSETDSP